MKPFTSRHGNSNAFPVRRALVVCSALAAMYGTTNVALAQAPSSRSDEPSKAQPEMQPQAVDALNKLGNYLRSVKSFRIDSDSVTDGVLSTGQNIGFLHHTEMSVQRPDKVRIVITGIRPGNCVASAPDGVARNRGDAPLRANFLLYWQIPLIRLPTKESEHV